MSLEAINERLASAPFNRWLGIDGSDAGGIHGAAGKLLASGRCVYAAPR